jgi:hypothetical protein
MAKRKNAFLRGTRGRAKPIAAKPVRTRGKTWKDAQAHFRASHAAFASSAALQRIIAAADVAKLGIDPKMLAMYADANRAAHEAMIAAGGKLAAKRTASLKAGRS